LPHTASTTVIVSISVFLIKTPGLSTQGLI
jgi:hypothetical protein